MTTEKQNDTICAISTPLGEGGIAIVRLSGSRSIPIADSLFRAPSKKKLSDALSHTIHYGHIFRHEVMLDEVLVSVFKAPRTYTAEDMVEINAHGGIVITRAILDALIEAGARLAEPGEFTKRAFLNGRIDLLQAESVIDVITAQSELSAKAALQQLEGYLSRALKHIREQLVTVRAHVESFVDFPEEGDQLYSDSKIKEGLSAVITELKRLADSYKNGEVIRAGVHTVFVGRPNVGKSSLLNVLLKRDRAIVSDFPGTTRDALEELIEIDGVLFRLVDTAGIMISPQHTLDYLSIEKTRQQYEKGDLIIVVFDAASPLGDEDKKIIAAIKDKKCLVVCNKTDQGVLLDSSVIAEEFGYAPEVLYLSVVTKKGVEELEHALGKAVLTTTSMLGETLVTRLRQKQAIESAYKSLLQALRGLDDKKGIELVAYDLQAAIRAIKELIGEVYSDEVLNVIFSEFCIGK
jgi:tRNA modification GTPase